MKLCYRTIRCMSCTADRLLPTAFGAELVETRLFDPHPALAVVHLIPGVVEGFFDGDQQSHGCTNLFRARLTVTDDAVELGDDIAVLGDPKADCPAVFVGHSAESSLHGHDTGGPSGGATA